MSDTPPSLTARREFLGRPLVHALLWVLLGLVAAWALQFHARICLFPYQLSPSEAGLYQSTRALHAGLNPWQPDLAPEYFNTYGIAQPWLTMQLKRLAPGVDLLRFMRLVCALNLWMSAALLFYAMRSAGAALLETLACCAAFYALQLFQNLAHARPDALYEVLYLGGIVWALRPGAVSAAGAGVLAALNYYVKPQGILTAPLAMVQLWSQGRRRDAAITAVTAVLVWAALAALMLRAFPHYFEGTLRLHFHASHLSVDWLLTQLMMMSQIHAVLLLVTAAGLLSAWRKGLPFLPQGAAASWTWLSIAAFLLLLAGPGLHIGAFLAYFYQQWLPLALVALVLWLPQLGLRREWLALALILDTGCSMLWLEYDRPSAPPSIEEWRPAVALVRAHPHGYYPPLLSTEVIKAHGFLTDTDHSHCLPYCNDKSGHSTLGDAYQARQLAIYHDLASAKFDAVVCGAYWPCPPGFTGKGYVEAEPLVLQNGTATFSVYLKR